MEHARIATPDDLPRVVVLARGLRTELAGYRGGALWVARDVEAEPLDDRFATALDRRDSAVVVGTIDEVVVGYGVVTIETLRDGARLGRIGELFVEPDARSVGVGEAMTRLIAERCRADGCRGIDVIALPGHRAAKNFFEEQAFTARALVMHRELDGGT